LSGIVILGSASRGETADLPRILLVAGTPSHAPMEHEFNAGVIILQRCLNESGLVQADAQLNGWPKDNQVFDSADAIVLYMDGGGGHPVIRNNNLEAIERQMKRGAGLVCIHYAVEVPSEKGGPEFLRWIGGYYETGYSINPHWDAVLWLNDDHPITRGVEPFKIRDEWYYNMRFPADGMTAVPILKGIPPDATRRTEAAAAYPGREEVLAWALARDDGGRGFGFTGAHFHRNWGDDRFRKIILNAIVWAAGLEVPEGGVASSVAADELEKNLDDKTNR
jgi:type 1 glutamine amidotransferase